MKNVILLLLVICAAAAHSQNTQSDTVWSKFIGSEVLQVKFSPDGGNIYVGAAGRKPFVVLTENGELIREYEQSFSSVTAMDLSKDGKYLAIGGENINRILLIETSTGNLFKEFVIPNEIVKRLSTIVILSISISNDFKYITVAISGSDKIDFNKRMGYCVTWFILENKFKEYFIDNNIQRARYSPTANFLAVCHSDTTINNITLYNTETWEELTPLCCHSYIIQDISFSPDGSLLASCGWDGYIKIWDVKEKKLVKEFSDNIEVNSVGFINNNVIIGGCGYFDKRYMKIWEISTGKFLGQLKINYPLDLDIMQEKYLCVVANNVAGLVLFSYSKILSDLPNNSTLKSQISPNPNSNQVTIQIAIPEPRNYDITIFDANTRKVDKLYNGFLEQGEHTFTWNTTPYPSGTYYCIIKYKNSSETLKIIVVR